MTNNTGWGQSGQIFRTRDLVNDLPELDVGIYMLSMDQFGFFLRYMAPKFEFNYKLYGLDTFPSRVAKTWGLTNGNLGVLMNGTKGTGKTVQMEQICNLVNLPVIIINSHFNGGVPSFLSTVNQDVIVAIDEYEKVFDGQKDEDGLSNGGNESLLTIMDGVLKNEYRRLFLLTTNNTYISDSMLNRPGRILYLKQFGNLSIPQTIEILNDMLVYPEHKESIVEFVKTLEIVTVDIVKAIVNEVNRFNEPPKEFSDFLNVKTRKNSTFDIVEINGRKQTVIAEGVTLHGHGGYLKENSPINYRIDPNDSYEDYKDLGRITSISNNIYTMNNGKVYKITKSDINHEWRKYAY